MKTVRPIVLLCLTMLVVPALLHAQGSGTLLTAAELGPYLPATLPDFDTQEVIDIEISDGELACAQVRYSDSVSPTSVTILLCDALLDQELYDSFIRCEGLTQVSALMSSAGIFNPGIMDLVDELGLVVPLTTYSYSMLTETSTSDTPSMLGDGSATMVPYESLEYEIAGWKVYDLQASLVGAHFLGVADRFPLLLWGNEIQDTNVLDQALDGVDIEGLEQQALQ